MLKITKAHDPIRVDHITMTIYSVPGIGKTSLAFTAEDPLLFDFDRGSYRSANRKDVVQIGSWEEVGALGEGDFTGYKTAVIDTAGRALDLLTGAIVRENPKMGNKNGGLTISGYGELKTVFIGWLKRLRNFGLDVVIVSHSEEQGRDEDLKERLDIQGGSKGEIYKSADCMGRLYMSNGKRTLNFSPTDTAFGKNPANLPPLLVPAFGGADGDPNYLAGIIRRTKEALNAMSEGQLEVTKLMAEWTDVVEKMSDVDAANNLVDLSQLLDERVKVQGKAFLKKKAEEKGWVFDGKAKAFVVKAA